MIECPQHHQSETADYCSVCGTQIDAAPLAAVAPSNGNCPQCNAAKESDRQVFCEVCGYNFRTAQPGVPVVVTAPAPVVATTVPHDPPVTTPAVKRWDVIVAVDANLYGEANADAPVDKPEQTFTLFEKENILGRATPGLRLQIPIANDVGVSRRHAVLLRSTAGLSVRDLGSANGTQLNGAEILPGVETTLQDGDVLGVGAWTRITIKAVQR
jgi:hypothetical protein